MLILSIILGLVEMVVSVLSEKGFDLGMPLAIMGLGQLVYIACRGAAEVIRLLHHLAVGIGIINPATNEACSVAPGSSILELLGEHARHKE